MGFVDPYPVGKPCDTGGCVPDLHGTLCAAHSAATKNHRDRFHTHAYGGELSGRALWKRSAEPLRNSEIGRLNAHDGNFISARSCAAVGGRSLASLACSSARGTVWNRLDCDSMGL